MPDIYYDPRHIQEEALKPLQEALYKLLNHTHTQTKVLQGVRYYGETVYRARINDKHRIVYTWIGEPRQLLILRVLESHKYDQVNRQLEGTTAKVQSFTLPAPGVNNNNNENTLQISPAPTKYLTQKDLILWDDYQQKALKLAMPMVLTGPPGSGKSAILLELLYQYTRASHDKPVLFLSQSPALVEQMQGYYEQEQTTNAQVQVMHFRTWEQVLAQSYPDQTCVAKGTFTDWLKNIDKTLDPKTSYYELSLITALGVASYQSLPLGRRQSYYSDNQSRKAQHIKLLQDWLDFLNTHKFFDPMVSSLPSEMKQVYEGIFCDELQNLPPIALASVLKLAVTKDVVFCMDLHQCLISSPFIDAGLKLLVQQYWDCKLTEHTLPRTWRSAQAVVAAANSLMNYKCSLDKFTRRAYSNLESALSTTGVVSWVTSAQIGQLERFARDDTAIIVHDLKDPALAPLKALGFHYVLTPEQAIGLEFRTVILVNLVTHLWDLFKHKEEHNDLTIEEMIALHRVFVALSRAMQQVFILETQKKPIQNWAQKVLGSLPENQFHALTTMQTVSKEQWLDRVKLHLQNEQDEPARIIMANYLNFSEEQINEQLQANKKSTVTTQGPPVTEPKIQVITDSPKGAKKKKKNNRPKNVQSLQSPSAGIAKRKVEKKADVKKNTALIIDLDTLEQQTQLKLQPINNLIPKKSPDPFLPPPKFRADLLSFLSKFSEQPGSLPLLMNSIRLTEFLFEAPVFEKERLFTRLLKTDFVADFLQQLASKKELIATYLFPEKIENFSQERVDFLIDLCMSQEGLQFFELLMENNQKVSSIIEFLNMHLMPSRHRNTSVAYWLSASVPGQLLLFRLMQKHRNLAGCLGELILSRPSHCEEQLLANLVSSTTGVSILNFLDPKQNLALKWEGIGAFLWEGDPKELNRLLKQLFYLALSIEMVEGQKISLELKSEAVQINCVFSEKKFIRTYGLVHEKLEDMYYSTEETLKKIPGFLFSAGKATAPLKVTIMTINPAFLKMPIQFDIDKIIVEFDAQKTEFSLYGLHCANPDFVKKIVNKTVQLQQETVDKKNVLHIAALQENVAIVNMFARNNLYLNSPDEHGFTPVNLAVYLNRLNLVALFLDHGACPNIQNLDGKTPLHYAVLNNNLPLVNLLLKTKSDVTLKDAQGKTAYCYANESIYRSQLVQIFIQNGMDVNYSTSDKITAAAYALLQEDEESFAYLVSSGADLNSPMSSGETLVSMTLGTNISSTSKARMLQILFKHQVNFAIPAYREKDKVEPIIDIYARDPILAKNIIRYMTIFHGEKVDFLKAKMMIENSSYGHHLEYFSKKFIQSVHGKANLRELAASENDEDLTLLIQNQSLLAGFLVEPDFQLDVFLHLLSRQKSTNLVALLLSHAHFIEHLSFELLTQKITDPALPFFGTSMLFWFCYSGEKFNLFTKLLERKPLLLNKLTYALFQKEHLFHLPITPIQLLTSHREGRAWLQSKLHILYSEVYIESSVFDSSTLKNFLEDYIKLVNNNPTNDKPVIAFQSFKRECTGLLLNDHQWIFRDPTQGHDFINCNDLNSFLNELIYLCAKDELFYLKITIFAPTNDSWELQFKELQVYDVPEVIDYLSLGKLYLKDHELYQLKNLLSNTERAPKNLLHKYGEQLILEAISLNNPQAVELLFKEALARGVKSHSLPFEKLIRYAIEQENKHLAQKIIETGVDLNSFKPMQDILFHVVIKNQLSKLAILALLKIPLDNPMNLAKDTAIIIAAKEGRQELFSELFRFGANIHRANLYGFTAVFWCIMRRDVAMLKSIYSGYNELPVAIEISADKLSDFNEGRNEVIHIKNIFTIWDNISKLITDKYKAGCSRLTVSAMELARIIDCPQIIELLETPAWPLQFFNNKLSQRVMYDDKENLAPAMNK